MMKLEDRRWKSEDGSPNAKSVVIIYLKLK